MAEVTHTDKGFGV